VHKPATSGPGPQARGRGQAADPLGYGGVGPGDDPGASGSYDLPDRPADRGRTRGPARRDPPGAYGPGGSDDSRASYGSGGPRRAADSYGHGGSRRGDGSAGSDSYGQGSQARAGQPDGSYGNGGPGRTDGSDRWYGNGGSRRARGSYGRPGSSQDSGGDYGSPDPLSRSRDAYGHPGRAGDSRGPAAPGRPGDGDRVADPSRRYGLPGRSAAPGRSGDPEGRYRSGGPEGRYSRPGDSGRGAPGPTGLDDRYEPSDRAGVGSYEDPGRVGVADPYRGSGRADVAGPYGRPGRRHDPAGPYDPDGPDGPDGPGGPDGPDDRRPGIGGHRARRPVRTRKNGKHRLRDRLWARIVAGALAVFLVIVGWSVGHALTAPGGGTISERLAEWARSHYLGPLVTFGEWLTYQPPKKGGKPAFAFTGGPSASAAALARQKRLAALYAPPAPLKPFVAKALPGEGRWRVLAVVNNEPAIFGTYLRPSSVYSSYVTGIAEMNPALLRFYLHPGAEDPGPGNWKVLSYLPPGARRNLVATFNSGFKIDVSGGGFYLNGITRGTLVRGVAAIVYYKDGHITIGNWGRGGLQMTPNVASVRQNLHLIVQNGRIPASVNYNVTTQWGATLGGGYYVWRSGIGMTKTGRIIFVYGPALNVQELAALLQRAGAVTAMQLDINPDWMSYMYYLPKGHPNNPTPENLLPDQMQPATRYYSPASRDFTAVYAR
jgi:hypothetical protein